MPSFKECRVVFKSAPWFLAILLAVFTAGEALSERRLALVVGNSAYLHVPVLKNTTNDAADISASMEKAGFEVTRGIDLNKEQLKDVFQTFASKLNPDDTALFFYAGHAIQVNGQNFLAPIDAKILKEDDIPEEAVSLNLILSILDSKSKNLLIFLDACRNNPFKRELGDSFVSVGQSAGLAREDVTSRNTLIAFATEPGNVAYDGAGNNSPFAVALLENIHRPGVEISTVMTDVRRHVFEGTGQKQLPWTNSSLLNYFYFLPSKENADPEIPRAAERIKDSSDPAALLAAANELYNARDFSRAAELYEKAAKLGAIRAMTAYGNILSQGIGVPKDPIEAHKWLEKAADSGDADAQFLVGRNYERGQGGVDKDMATALQWYRKSAENDNSDAMNNLAVMYVLGEGVASDVNEAARWYQNAAEKGNGNAMFNLAALYDDGHGVTKSAELAVTWVMRSILTGTANAKLEMANNSAAWSKDFRRRFQAELKAADLYTGTVDGLFGPGTRQAIEKLE